jgi:hypothetical protein
VHDARVAARGAQADPVMHARKIGIGLIGHVVDADCRSPEVFGSLDIVYFTSTSSIWKMSVAFGGMTLPAPCGP